MVSGGSLSSRSLTPDGDTMSVHASPDWRSSAGTTVYVVGPPVTENATEPLIEHWRVSDAEPSATGSLKVTVGFTVPGAVAPLAGVNDATVGAASAGGSVPHSAVWAPRPSKVSTAKPSHSTAGSKASVATGSPAQIEALRRRVLSAVLTRPVPHWVVGLPAI